MSIDVSSAERVNESTTAVDWQERAHVEAFDGRDRDMVFKEEFRSLAYSKGEDISFFIELNPDSRESFSRSSLAI
jgi:hypothetical protein